MSLETDTIEALSAESGTAESADLPDQTLWIMAAACGTAAANIFYNQPLLGSFAAHFHATSAQVGMVATAAQVGYGLGIFFFVPLGDLIERRKMVLWLTAACFILLLCAAAAPKLGVLVLCQLLIGIAAVGAQLLIPLGIDLTPPHKRGHTIGILMAGLLMGVLLARTVAGVVGDAFGWRATFILAAGVTLIMGFILRVTLPERAPSIRMSYGRLMHSMLELLATQKQLWVAALVSGCSFASFTAFWTTLSFLMIDHFHRGASEAGMFGLVGIAGALGAPLAGKLSDKHGPFFTVTLAISSSIAAFILMDLRVTIASLIIGVFLMDLGIQSIQVAKQATVMALLPQARSRINTLYMVGRFLGGAAGSAIGALVWSRLGWSGVCWASIGMLLLAMIVHLLGSDEKGVLVPIEALDVV